MPKGKWNNPDSLFLRKVQEFEANLIRQAIIDCRDVKAAAAFLGLDWKTLSRMCRRHGIDHRALKREAIKIRKADKAEREEAERLAKEDRDRRAAEAKRKAFVEKGVLS